jgi:hypothetical protein
MAAVATSGIGNPYHSGEARACSFLFSLFLLSLLECRIANKILYSWERARAMSHTVAENITESMTDQRG